MFAVALRQWGKVGHAALAEHAPTFPNVPALLALDRDYSIFHQEQHRSISSPSQTDPPAVFV